MSVRKRFLSLTRKNQKGTLTDNEVSALRAIAAEAFAHASSFAKWRAHRLNVSRLLIQDLGYFSDEREHCEHCRAERLGTVKEILSTINLSCT